MSPAKCLRAHIRKKGPLPLDRFLDLAMNATNYSYYSSADRFGEEGDFTTAPEISQLFGEILAAFQAWLWEVSGSPDANEMIIFEAGPGRGTLFGDMHRCWRQICPQMAAAPVTFLETSPYLRSKLTSRFSGLNINLAEDADGLPEVPLFGVANEFFDALAIRQAVKREQGWVWRMVGLNTDEPQTNEPDSNPFVFCDGPALNAAELRHYALASNSPTGQVAEMSPASEAVLARLARHVARFGGGLLICDYGKADRQGDSLQAVRAHKAVPVLDKPGLSDISHLVDFGALAHCAKEHGSRLVGPVEQGCFLRELGIEQRAEALRRANEPERDRILTAALDRLCAPQHMGGLFKIAVLVPAGEGLPAGFNSLRESDTEKTGQLEDDPHRIGRRNR